MLWLTLAAVVVIVGILTLLVVIGGRRLAETCGEDGDARPAYSIVDEAEDILRKVGR